MSRRELVVTEVKDARALDRNAPARAVAVTVADLGPFGDDLDFTVMAQLAVAHVDGRGWAYVPEGGVVGRSMTFVVTDPSRWGPDRSLPAGRVSHGSRGAAGFGDEVTITGPIQLPTADQLRRQ